MFCFDSGHFFSTKLLAFHLHLLRHIWHIFARKYTERIIKFSKAIIVILLNNLNANFCNGVYCDRSVLINLLDHGVLGLRSKVQSTLSRASHLNLIGRAHEDYYRFYTWRDVRAIIRCFWRQRIKMLVITDLVCSKHAGSDKCTWESRDASVNVG